LVSSELTTRITKVKNPSANTNTNKSRKKNKHRITTTQSPYTQQPQQQLLVQTIPTAENYERVSKQTKWLRSDIDTIYTKAPLKTAVSLVNNTISLSQANRLRSTQSNEQVGLGGNSGIAISEEELKLKFPNAIAWEGDPYDDLDKDQFHESTRTDGMVKRAIKFLITFIIGKDNPDTQLQTNLVYKSDDDKAQALKVIQNNDQYQVWKLTIDEIDDETDFYNRLKAALYNCLTYGRSVLVKLYNSNGLPVRVIPLSSRRLGKVWIDATTWEFLAVEYLDYPDERRLLLAENIIYFSLDDFNLTPNSLYYGTSLIEPVAWISEANRVMHQKDIPEIVEKFWAPSNLVESFSMDDEENKSIIDAIEPGRNVLVRGGAKIQQVRYDAPIEDIVKLSDLQNMKILRDMSVPLLAGGFENIQNRAVALTVVQQWGESTPKEYREWLQGILEKQWYEPNLQTIVNRDVQQCEGCIFEMLGITKPNLEIDDSQKTQEQIMEERKSFDLTGRIKFPFKIGVLFSEIIVDTFLDRTAAVVSLHKEGIINEDIALDLANLDKYREEMRLEREKEERQRVVQLTAELEAVRQEQEQGQQQQGQPSDQQPEEEIGNGKAKPLTQKEKEKEKEKQRPEATPLNVRLSNRARA
jgi:hypothetical protein